MLEQIKQRWRRFKEPPPGERFRKHFERRQEGRQRPFQKFLFIGGGILIMAAGVFFLPAPGPGTVVLFLGAALIAQESLFAARALDWIDVRVRKLVAWSLGVWRRAPVPVKLLLVLGALALLGAAGFGVYKVL